MVRTVGLRGYSDVHFTDTALARRIVEHFAPAGRCLEPFKGEGAFLNHLPAGTEFCEITEGRDFFEHRTHADWILKLAQQYGGCREILHVGTGRDIGFDIGFPFGALHFAKDYRGPIYESNLAR